MASLNPVSKANTSFSLDLFKKLSDKDKTANVFYSPFSISSALAMVMLGARGNTASQMNEVSRTALFFFLVSCWLTFQFPNTFPSPMKMMHLLVLRVKASRCRVKSEPSGSIHSLSFFYNVSTALVIAGTRSILQNRGSNKKLLTLTYSVHVISYV